MKQEILSNPQINDRFVFNTGTGYLVLLLREFEDDAIWFAMSKYPCSDIEKAKLVMKIIGHEGTLDTNLMALPRERFAGMREVEAAYRILDEEAHNRDVEAILGEKADSHVKKVSPFANLFSRMSSLIRNLNVTNRGRENDR